MFRDFYHVRELVLRSVKRRKNTILDGKTPEERFVWHVNQAERHVIGALKRLYDHEMIHRGSGIKRRLERAQKALTVLHTNEI